MKKDSLRAVRFLRRNMPFLARPNIKLFKKFLIKDVFTPMSIANILAKMN